MRRRVFRYLFAFPRLGVSGTDRAAPLELCGHRRGAKSELGWSPLGWCRLGWSHLGWFPLSWSELGCCLSVTRSWSTGRCLVRNGEHIRRSGQHGAGWSRGRGRDSGRDWGQGTSEARGRDRRRDSGPGSPAVDGLINGSQGINRSCITYRSSVLGCYRNAATLGGRYLRDRKLLRRQLRCGRLDRKNPSGWCLDIARKTKGKTLAGSCIDVARLRDCPRSLLARSTRFSPA